MIAADWIGTALGWLAAVLAVAGGASLVMIAIGIVGAHNAERKERP